MSSAEAEDFSVSSTEQLDRINLEQALIDFEIANARVVDLTGRLTGLSTEVMRLRSELGAARLKVSISAGEADAYRNEIAEIKRSLAYRVLRTLGDARARVKNR